MVLAAVRVVKILVAAGTPARANIAELLSASSSVRLRYNIGLTPLWSARDHRPQALLGPAPGSWVAGSMLSLRSGRARRGRVPKVHACYRHDFAACTRPPTPVPT